MLVQAYAESREGARPVSRARPGIVGLHPASPKGLSRPGRRRIQAQSPRDCAVRLYPYRYPVVGRSRGPDCPCEPFPVALSGVIVPLPRLQSALDIHQLSLRQELTADFGQAIPRDTGMVFGPLAISTAVLVGRDRKVVKVSVARTIPINSRTPRLVRLKSRPAYGSRRHPDAPSTVETSRAVWRGVPCGSRPSLRDSTYQHDPAGRLAVEARASDRGSHGAVHCG